MSNENGHHRKSKDDLLKEVLNEDEYEMVRAKRELDAVEPGTPSYKVLLQFDHLRRQRDQTLWAIEQRFNDIESGLVGIARCESQIESGNINEEIKPGVVMTKRELRNYINKQYALVKSNVKDFINHLAPLRRLVGCRDAAGNTVLSEEQFNEIVKQSEERLREMGYDLFDEDVKNS